MECKHVMIDFHIKKNKLISFLLFIEKCRELKANVNLCYNERVITINTNFYTVHSFIISSLFIMLLIYSIPSVYCCLIFRYKFASDYFTQDYTMAFTTKIGSSERCLQNERKQDVSNAS